MIREGFFRYITALLAIDEPWSCNSNLNVFWKGIRRKHKKYATLGSIFQALNYSYFLFFFAEAPSKLICPDGIRYRNGDGGDLLYDDRTAITCPNSTTTFACLKISFAYKIKDTTGTTEIYDGFCLRA